jgi:tetratricopeptide (TPR) repeat protein
MDGRRRLAAPLFALLALPLWVASPAAADDPPAPPPDLPTPKGEEPKPDAPKPEAPKPDEPKKERKKTDDTSIFADWKLVKQGGIKNARDRAAFWEGKGTSGKNLAWLGFMWNRGEVYDKAAATWEQFLEWKPPEGDSKEAVKDRETNAKNRETIRKELIGAYIWKGDYPAAIKAGAQYREEFPNSSGIPESWDWEGQAYRLAGDEDKALEAFGKAAELKYVGGFLDVIDVHLAAGRIDDAKATFTKYPPEDAKAPFLKDVKAFLDMVGTDAPPLTSAVNIGQGTAPTDWKGKVTAAYHWHGQLSNGVNRMKAFDHMVTELGDKAQDIGISSYHKLNTETDKVEADMTEEKEAEGMRKLVANVFPRDIPAPVMMPKELVEQLGLKQEGQAVVVDAEGKIRYMRLNDRTKYDLKAVQLAMKKLMAPTTAPGGG